MEGNHIRTYPLLAPLAWLYGAGVTVRNWLFDRGILEERTFDVPVICVGNITVGGTGKTPHTEYLIRLLSKEWQVAVLSRGYKRKSKGFVLAEADTPMEQIGDEPFQMKRKFPHIHMAVDRDRRQGIERLCSPNIEPATDVVVLDDAYQHRYVKPGLNILLIDYHRLIYFDKVLPEGRLREPAGGKKRADILVVTKCPKRMAHEEMQDITERLRLHPGQKVFFTRYDYPKTLGEEAGENPLIVTGIASPRQMEYDLRKILPRFEMMTFPDHHLFTKKDMERIRERGKGRTILTTEKDATRLRDVETKVIPIEVTFMGKDKQEEFNNIILNYVRENSRNSVVLESKNGHEA